MTKIYHFWPKKTLNWQKMHLKDNFFLSKLPLFVFFDLKINFLTKNYNFWRKWTIICTFFLTLFDFLTKNYNFLSKNDHFRPKKWPFLTKIDLKRQVFGQKLPLVVLFDLKRQIFFDKKRRFFDKNAHFWQKLT